MKFEPGYAMESHMGGYYITDDPEFMSQRCEMCGDSDWVLGYVKTISDYVGIVLDSFFETTIEYGPVELDDLLKNGPRAFTTSHHGAERYDYDEMTTELIHEVIKNRIKDWRTENELLKHE